MATVFMKWLESSPEDYDRGINLLTLGWLKRVKGLIANRVSPETRVLEIGCGTGTLTQLMAQRGAIVTAIDASPLMMQEAKHKISQSGLEERVTLELMDATSISDHFSPASFDLIVSTLVFSELPQPQQRYVLEACTGLLAPNGRLLIADELIPIGTLSRILYTLVRLPLAILTWLLTRTTTRALHNFESLLTDAGFQAHQTAAFLGGSLVIFEGQLRTGESVEMIRPSATIRRLRHQVTLRTLLFDLWALFFRIIPPYPKVQPGLYRVGQPDPKAPVLVTGNFDLTVRRLVKVIDGRLHAWLLVADSAGINVWCAAGGGYFTAEKVIAAVNSSHLEEYVSHHALILPQLCANGVDGWQIRKETGWGVHWGPALASDIPAYLDAHRKKSEAMRWVRFPLKDRLEMVTATLGFYSLLILLPFLIFWRHLFWPVAASLVGLSYFYTIVHPWLPGRDGLWKSIPLTLIALAGLIGYSILLSPLPTHTLFNWGVGLTGLSVFVGAELQGMSPLMRGEQANWGWEAVIGGILAAVYWLFPLIAGWR